MATLKNIFDKCGVALYQNESLDLDHYYQEPYQDEGDEIKVIGEPFETDKSKKIRPYDLFAEDRTFSNFSFFMDGSRRTYKIGDIVIDGGKKIYPVVIAQIRAGCTERDGAKKLHSHQTILRKNLLLLSDKINTVDFKEIQQRLMRTAVAKEMFLEVVSYRFESEKHNIPVNAAIAKANSMMHDMEIEILSNMVKSGSLDTDRMLIVDGPLQFLRQDTGKAEFSDLFYNVIGVSKSFNPMLPASGKSKRGGTQIGAELLKLEYGERTPVFMKENDRGRRFGVWYLRIRPKNRVSNPLEGIIKIEKMALEDYYDSGIPKRIIIFVDELNKYAPSTSSKNSPLLANLLDITERGRSEGVILFSAEQFRSAIHDRIKGNCGTNIYGRTNAIEVSRPDYKFVPSVYANMMTRLKKGDLIVHHPVFKTLLKIQFPFPSYNQGGSK